MKYRSLLFDLHFTLIKLRNTPAELFVSVAKSQNIEVEVEAVAEALEAASKVECSEINKTLNSEKTLKAFWIKFYKNVLLKLKPNLSDATCDEFGKKMNDNFFEHSENFEVIEGVTDLLRDLKAQNIKLAVLTNSTRGVHKIITDVGLREYFDEVFISTEIGFSKPDPRIITHCIDKMAVQRHECLLIGDSFESDI